MKAPLYYAIRTGSLYNPVIAVTSEKRHRWHGRDVRDNMATHGVLSDIKGRFETREAAEAMRERVGKLADSYDEARKVLANATSALDAREREATATLLAGGDPPMAQLPRVIYGDLKLLAHFRRMQEMAAQFVTPEPYQGFTPGNAQLIVGDESVDRGVFISDMIYMLDGPEQRDAQREAEGLRTQPPPA
jgi:hypothetical protein